MTEIVYAYFNANDDGFYYFDASQQPMFSPKLAFLFKYDLAIDLPNVTDAIGITRSAFRRRIQPND